MGYMRHHAIVVTGFDERVDEARSEAFRLCREAFEDGRIVSAVVHSLINGYRSFCLFPDGSKEGWENSHAGDRVRDDLVAFMEGMRYEDCSSPLSWAEVQYGDDERQTKVVRHSDSEGGVDEQATDGSGV
jgi:hypothetical protein